MKLRFSNFISSIWTRSICQIRATFPGVEFLRTSSKFKKIKENLLSDVHVLHKTVKFLSNEQGRGVRIGRKIKIIAESSPNYTRPDMYYEKNDDKLRKSNNVNIRRKWFINKTYFEKHHVKVKRRSQYDVCFLNRGTGGTHVCFTLDI